MVLCRRFSGTLCSIELIGKFYCKILSRCMCLIRQVPLVNKVRIFFCIIFYHNCDHFGYLHSTNMESQLGLGKKVRIFFSSKYTTIPPYFGHLTRCTKWYRYFLGGIICYHNNYDKYCFLVSFAWYRRYHLVSSCFLVLSSDSRRYHLLYSGGTFCRYDSYHIFSVSFWYHIGVKMIQLYFLIAFVFWHLSIDSALSKAIKLFCNNKEILSLCER